MSHSHISHTSHSHIIVTGHMSHIVHTLSSNYVPFNESTTLSCCTPGHQLPGLLDPHVQAPERCLLHRLCLDVQQELSTRTLLQVKGLREGRGRRAAGQQCDFSTITARLGLQTVFSLVRCPIFRMSFTERFHCTTSRWVLLPLTITNLVFERVPPLSVGGEVKLLQGNSHLSQELVPPEAVPVPHTQPESAAQQG